MDGGESGIGPGQSCMPLRTEPPFPHGTRQRGEDADCPPLGWENLPPASAPADQEVPRRQFLARSTDEKLK